MQGEHKGLGVGAGLPSETVSSPQWERGQESYGSLWWEGRFGKLGVGAKCGGSLKSGFGLSLEPRDPQPTQGPRKR